MRSITKSLLRIMVLGMSLYAIAWAGETDEERVGNAAAAKIFGAAPLVPSAEAQRYINLVGGALASQAGAKYAWRFGVIDSDQINAFALPGGVVLLTRGMARLIKSEEELAFILSHEIGHVVRQHHYRVVQRQRLAARANEALQSVSAEGLTELAGASAQIYARGLDKSAEFEADRLGTQLMASSGYDPAAALGVLEALLAAKNSADTKADWLFSTHPQPEQRIDQLLAAGIADIPAGSGVEARRVRFKVFSATLQ